MEGVRQSSAAQGRTQRGGEGAEAYMWTAIGFGFVKVVRDEAKEVWRILPRAAHQTCLLIPKIPQLPI